MRPLKMNCRKIYELGVKYSMYSGNIRYNQKKLLNIKDNIKECWTGKDSDTFENSFLEHINAISDLVSFLEDESEVLKKNALSHSDNDNSFAMQMKRSGNV